MDYDQHTLNGMAYEAVFELGTFVSWSIRVTDEGTSLVVFYNVGRPWTAPGAATFDRKDISIAL